MKFKTTEDSIKHIDEFLGLINRKPIAFQSLWGSDFDSIWLTFAVIYKKESVFEKEGLFTYDLYKSFETEEELVEAVNKHGNYFSEKYNVEFYFPSPDEWSRDCPDWWLVPNSPICKICETPNIADDYFLKSGLCYPCNLREEFKLRHIEMLKDFKIYVSMVTYMNKLQFYCEDCITKIGEVQTSTDYSNIGRCDMCNSFNLVSNPLFNKWFYDRGLSISNRKEFKELIPYKKLE